MPSSMLRPVYRFMIRGFGKRYDYDTGYMILLLDETPSLMNALNGLSKLSNYQKNAPLEAHVAARLTGVRAEDCGPCLQLTIDMARERGMSGPLTEAILSGDVDSMCTDSALGFRFASATLTRSGDEEAARDAVRDAYGEAAVIELTLASQISRVFPMLKRGLGFDKTCKRTSVGTSQIDGVRGTT